MGLCPHARGSGYGAIRLDASWANPVALRLYHGLGYRDAGGATFRKGPFRCFEKRLQFDPAANPEAIAERIKLDQRQTSLIERDH